LEAKGYSSHKQFGARDWAVVFSMRHLHSFLTGGLSCVQDGYDHSYYLMSTFMDDHLEHAAKHLAKL
jgi:hypothetical protein